MFKILALKEVIASVLYLTELTLLLLRVSAYQKLYAKFLKLKTSSMITGFKPIFVLKISVASICRFFDVFIQIYFALTIAERLAHNLYKQFLRHVHGYCLFDCLIFYCETSIPADNVQTAKR